MAEHTPPPWEVFFSAQAAEFGLLWTGYALAPDATLDQHALALKRELRKITGIDELVEALDGMLQMLSNHFALAGIKPGSVAEIQRGRAALKKAKEVST